MEMFMVEDLRLGISVLKWWCDQECLDMEILRMEDQEEKWKRGRGRTSRNRRRDDVAF